MQRSRRHATRGQGATEMVLGLLLFVTILMFGIHFAEVSYLSVKTTEATHSALLDTPGYKLHDWPKDVSPSAQAIQTAAQAADARYKDFDSRTNSGAGTLLKQVYTQAEGMSVTCDSGGPTFQPHFWYTQGAYQDNGGMHCQSESTLRAIHLPRVFLQEASPGGFFQVPHYRPEPLRVCGMGRAVGGTCSARVSMLLDDWGLAGYSEGKNCTLIPDAPVPCQNDAYWNMAFSVFLRNGLGQGIAGSALAQKIVNGPPLPFIYGSENAFWMSSQGEDALPPFMQPLWGETWKLWPTTPGALPPGLNLQSIPYPAAYLSRGRCFLGRACP